MKEWQVALFVTLSYLIITMIGINIAVSGHIIKAMLVTALITITFTVIMAPLAIRNFYLNHPEYNQYGEKENRKDALSNRSLPT